MVTPIRIRSAQGDDWPQLECLVAGICRYHGDTSALTRDTFFDFALRDNAPMIVLVAETEDGILAGFAAGFPRFDFPQGQTLFEIHNLFVLDSFRRQRIGEVLMIGTMQAARQKFGNVRFGLGALRWNATALEFYKQLGFTPNDRSAETIRLVRDVG